jgi:hypothetical protein
MLISALWLFSVSFNFQFFNSIRDNFYAYLCKGGAEVLQFFFLSFSFPKILMLSNHREWPRRRNLLKAILHLFEKTLLQYYSYKFHTSLIKSEMLQLIIAGDGIKCYKFSANFWLFKSFHCWRCWIDFKTSFVESECDQLRSF